MRTAAGLLALCALLSSATAIGQTGNGDADAGSNWYRVELIIFANRDPDAALSERWPLLPDLSYPATWQRLSSEDAFVPGDRDYQLLRVEDTVPAEAFDLAWDRSIEELEREHQRSLVYRQAEIQLESLYDLNVPRARVRLDSEFQEFTSQRRRIDRSATLDVLFHETWLEPVRNQQEAQALLIDTAVASGDYPELQGSVLLYVGRYLHIVTDLWINTDGAYLGNNWVMPRPPLTPVSGSSDSAVLPFEVIVATDWLAETGPIAEPGTETEPESQTGTWAEPFAALPAERGTEELADDPELDAAAQQLADLDIDAEQMDSAQEQQLQAFLDLPVYDYDFRHAVHVQQRRRMRSGELHYIDHPLLGIIVKVSRHEFPALLEEATELNPALAGNR
ncbi:MAG: CsiV family protein [Halieaceae bacterium]